MTARALRWADLTAGLRSGPLQSDLVVAVLATLAAAATLWQPVAALVLLLFTTVFAVLWRRPESAVYALVVLMGNVKVNYYAGFFTFFPEYLLLVVAGCVWLLRRLEAPRPLPEPAFFARFGLWVLAGACSFVFAPLVGKVFARVVLALLVGVVALIVVEAVRTRRVLARTLAVWEISAVLFAAYGIAQMIGLAVGLDLSPRLLEKYGNPDLAVGVGEPVRLRIQHIFRANSLFNDPNILAGYLAAATAGMLALSNWHSNSGRRVRARFEIAGVAVMLACLLLTLSRSGFLALAAGLSVVVSQWPGALRRPSFWIALVVLLAGTVVAGLALDVNPIVLFQRLTGTFDTNDGSNRVHAEVFLFGLRLFTRFPLTGAGLGNFGEYYGLEQDAHARNMMTHCAPLSAFAETGIFGGFAFLALTGWVLSRPWSLVRDRALRARDPQLHAYATALLAALVAVGVANLFYDYYLRTFVWVLSGLAVALPRLRAHDPEPGRA